MAIENEPEINLARLVTARFQLTPPIDVEQLVKKYAVLKYAEIPFEGVDGVSVNLKVSGKKPTVIVSEANPPLRQRFTLAHELGHIVIPWHIGTIIDHIDSNHPRSSSEYWQIESEANGFAAELLMPTELIEETLSTEKDLAKAHCEISSKCKTSAHATAMQMSRLLPSNIVYASIKNGKVEFSGKTEGTLAPKLTDNIELPSSPYDYCEHHYTAKSRDRVLHWWTLPGKIKLSTNDGRGWRDILDQILRDLGVPRDQRTSVVSQSRLYNA
jgi:Zn-dependent peptidase ImmA (M78 family)